MNLPVHLRCLPVLCEHDEIVQAVEDGDMALALEMVSV
jgi:hypothetical protein